MARTKQTARLPTNRPTTGGKKWVDTFSNPPPQDATSAEVKNWSQKKEQIYSKGHVPYHHIPYDVRVKLLKDNPTWTVKQIEGVYNRALNKTRVFVQNKNK